MNWQVLINIRGLVVGKWIPLEKVCLDSLDLLISSAHRPCRLPPHDFEPIGMHKRPKPATAFRPHEILP